MPGERFSVKRVMLCPVSHMRMVVLWVLTLNALPSSVLVAA